MRLLAAPLLLTSSLFSLAAQTAPAPASPSASQGTAVYRDDALRLSYRYPADYVDASAMVGPAFEASIGQDPAAATAAKCMTAPFSRMGAGKKEISLVLILQANASCFGKKFNAKSVTEFAQGEAQGLAASGAKVNFGQPANFEVAGRPASLVQGAFTLPTGQSMQAMVVCVLDQPDVACWQFLAQTTAGLSALSALPVTFDGSPATPLVPASVLTKP